MEDKEGAGAELRSEAESAALGALSLFGAALGDAQRWYRVAGEGHRQTRKRVDGSSSWVGQQNRGERVQGRT